MRIKYFFATLLRIIFFFSTITARSQDSSHIKVSGSFDSLLVATVKATGNLNTGTVEVSMQYENHYSIPGKVSVIIGVFGDFGLTDNKGNKYKVYNQNTFQEANINMGYRKISAVQFGDKKLDWIRMLQQDMPAGKSMVLTMRINSFDKSATTISEMHVQTMLTSATIFSNQNLYKVEDIRIHWFKPAKDRP